MSRTLPLLPAPRHLLSSETSRPSPAKANLRKAEADVRWLKLLGHVVDEARYACSWNLDELADKVQRDSRQVARWLTGDERPQFDRLFAVPELQRPLVVAFARLVEDGSVEVETTIRVKRIEKVMSR